jgi:hypothetical protein
MSEEKYTEEQVKAYGEEIIRQHSQEKSNTHAFLTKVIDNDSTLKTGNINEEELGNPQINLRGLKELELFSRKIEKNELWADYFEGMAEIVTAPSLSKEGFLLKLAVTNKKELADVTPQRKRNKGWFSKKGESTE